VSLVVNPDLQGLRRRDLHQLRRSAPAHDARKGTGTPVLMVRSGHTSVRSLTKHARVSAGALARHQSSLTRLAGGRDSVAGAG
jgi:hypothetical protein